MKKILITMGLFLGTIISNPDKTLANFIFSPTSHSHPHSHHGAVRSVVTYYKVTISHSLVEHNLWLQNLYRTSSGKEKYQILKNGEILEGHESRLEGENLKEEPYHLQLQPEKNQITYIVKEHNMSLTIPATFSEDTFTVKGKDVSSVFSKFMESTYVKNLRNMDSYDDYFFLKWGTTKDQIESLSANMKGNLSDMVCSLQTRMCQIARMSINISIDFYWPK